MVNCYRYNVVTTNIGIHTFTATLVALALLRVLCASLQLSEVPAIQSSFQTHKSIDDYILYIYIKMQKIICQINSLRLFVCSYI